MVTTFLAMPGGIIFPARSSCGPILGSLRTHVRPTEETPKVLGWARQDWDSQGRAPVSRPFPLCPQQAPEGSTHSHLAHNETLPVSAMKHASKSLS